MSVSVEEILYWRARCECGHQRNDHEPDGVDGDGADIWGCYGHGIGEEPCYCLTPRYP